MDRVLCLEVRLEGVGIYLSLSVQVLSAEVDPGPVVAVEADLPDYRAPAFVGVPVAELQIGEDVDFLRALSPVDTLVEAFDHRYVPNSMHHP